VTTHHQDQLAISGPRPTPAAKRPGIKTADVLAALTAHYRKPGEEFSGEILITEPQAPGSSRRCDLLRVGLWQSRGTGIDVHEIKVSRPDWLRELDAPAKAEAWWPYCSRFWIAAPPGIVAPGELPQGWGLMELPSSGRRFKVKVPAASKQPELTVRLLIELLRRADNARLDEMRRLRSECANEVFKARHERQEKAAEAELPYELRQRLNFLERIETALGMPLDQFGGWPKYPPSKLTPEELAAYLADARDHVTAQRRAAGASRVLDSLRHAATGVLQQVETIRNQGGASR
jgi:hypothetical protein